MALPAARPGLVFRYEYIWKRQDLAGQTTGEKERPACVVLAVSGAAGGQRVLIVPITTQQPGRDIPAMEIPQTVKRHLGLDKAAGLDRPQRANLDSWPSPDIAYSSQPSQFE
jgi:hypothetical protein